MEKQPEVKYNQILKIIVHASDAVKAGLKPVSC